MTRRNILSHHATTACQPRKEAGAITSLDAAKLGTPTPGAAEGRRASACLPRAFQPGDALETEQESPCDRTTALEAQQAARLDTVALFLASGSRALELQPNAFQRGAEGVESIRAQAQELQAEHGDLQNNAIIRSAGLAAHGTSGAAYQCGLQWRAAMANAPMRSSRKRTATTASANAA